MLNDVWSSVAMPHQRRKGLLRVRPRTHCENLLPKIELTAYEWKLYTGLVYMTATLLKRHLQARVLVLKRRLQGRPKQERRLNDQSRSARRWQRRITGHRSTVPCQEESAVQRLTKSEFWAQVFKVSVPHLSTRRA